MKNPLAVSSLSRHAAGILLFVFSAACFSGMNVCIRLLDGALPSPQTVFLRNALSLVLLLPIVAYHRPRQMRTDRIIGHFWRALVGLVGMELWFYSLTLMPLNEATALGFLSPIFATILAGPLLGERIGIRRGMAVILGFCGALIILRPDPEAGLHPGALTVLLAAVMWALAGIVVKRLTATDPPWRIVTYMAIFMSIFSAPLALLHWLPVTTAHLLPLAGIVVFSTVAQLAMVMGFSRTPMVVLMPFDFMRLVFTAAFAYTVFGERLDTRTALGAAVIVGSSVFITWREARRNRAAPQPL